MMLLPNKLKDQYCFKTKAAIECLKFVEGEKIWLKEQFQKKKWIIQ